MEEIKRKRGRPKIKGSLTNQYRIRMSDDMTNRLEELHKKTGMSKADIFRRAFYIFENMEKTKIIEDEAVNDFDDFYDDWDDNFDEEYD